MLHWSSLQCMARLPQMSLMRLRDPVQCFVAVHSINEPQCLQCGWVVRTKGDLLLLGGKGGRWWISGGFLMWPLPHLSCSCRPWFDKMPGPWLPGPAEGTNLKENINFRVDRSCYFIGACLGFGHSCNDEPRWEWGASIKIGNPYENWGGCWEMAQQLRE